LFVEDQQFAAPGSYKPLYCKGRHCAKCGKCRDWYYTGDAASWQWIRSVKNWDKSNRDRWNNDRVGERFEKRDGATCDLGDHGYYGYYGYDGGGVYYHYLVDHGCLCDDNVCN
jgi:hypothetical protein